MQSDTKIHESRLGFIHQESGNPEGPPAIYLPGVHGDWSRMDGARALLGKRLRLIEVTYPMATTWSLRRYGEALEDLMDVLELDSAHLIGESFGSLLGWEIGLKCPRRVRSLVVAGGFIRAPRPDTLAVARRTLGVIPASVLQWGAELLEELDTRVGDPENPIDRNIMPYYAMRSDKMRRATAARLAIVQETDFRRRLDGVRFHVGYIGGSADPFIPVRREAWALQRLLHKSCRFDSHILPGAPHHILVSDPAPTARFILMRIAETEVDGACK